MARTFLQGSACINRHWRVRAIDMAKYRCKLIFHEPTVSFCALKPAISRIHCPGIALSLVGTLLSLTTQSRASVCPNGATVPGVDVSVYQAPVNWPSVKAAGKVFAFARVSDGTYLDTAFNPNWTGIKAAGMVRGVYQFFEPGEDPTVQANILIQAVYADTNTFAYLRPGDLPAVLDVEVTGGQSPATIAAHIQTWINQVQSGTGRVPMIYTALGFWDGSVASTAFSANPLWAANWGVTCPSLAEGWTNWAFWQYSDTGTVNGITNAVDLDEFNGSLNDLLAFANEPSLSIAWKSTNHVAITWSSYAIGFTLQQNANPNSANWANVTNTPSEVSNQEQVILVTSTNRTFFRLFHP